MNMFTPQKSDLESKLEGLNNGIERLKVENNVLDKFITKKSLELGKDDDDKRKRRKDKKMNAILLTSEQKYEISNIIHEESVTELESNRLKSEKMIDTLRSVLEETDIRINELKRDTYEFKRDIVVGAENIRTGKIMAERIIHYFEEKFKKTDAYIGKLRLKNSALKSQIAKIEHQLQQKEEAGDVLHYIDFHQLQIENKNYLSKIEDRNSELSSLKLSTGKTIQILNDYKKRLNDETNEATWLKQEIINKKSLLEKYNKEAVRVKKEDRSETSLRDRLRMQIEETHDMPNIQDYIMQKKEMYDLQSSLKNWKKKVEIIEIAAKKAKYMSNKMKTERLTSTAANPIRMTSSLAKPGSLK